MEKKEIYIEEIWIMPAFSPFSHYTEPLAAQILRRHMGSKKNLVAVILTSTALLLSIVASLVQSMELQSQTALLAQELYGASASAAAGSQIGAVVGTVFGILLSASMGALQLVALWMIFAAAHSRKSPMGTAGFTMQKVLAIIQLSILGLCVLLMLLCFVLMAISFGVLQYALSSAFELAEIPVAMGAVVFILLIVLTLGIVGYAVVVCISMMQTALRMRATARTGLPGKPIPMFYIVNLFISAGISVLSLFSAISSLIIAPGFGTALLLLAYPVSAAANILYALVLLGYRRELRELQPFVPSHAPVPAPAVPAAAATAPWAEIPVAPSPATAAPAAPVPSAPVPPAPAPLEAPPTAGEQPTVVSYAPMAPDVQAPAPVHYTTHPGRVCPFCGAEQPADARFCGQCGRPL